MDHARCEIEVKLAILSLDAVDMPATADLRLSRIPSSLTVVGISTSPECAAAQANLLPLVKNTGVQKFVPKLAGRIKSVAQSDELGKHLVFRMKN